MSGKIKPSQRFGTLIGTSQGIRRVFALIEKAASVEFPVFIVGETGTGKELVAREIHARGSRSGKPFVAVNMGAVPSELVASELFGHERGSFTGATHEKPGRFQEAKGGTLFLDEIFTMEHKVQIALLRVLETRKARRIGSNRDYSVDVRILAAANQDPAQMVDTRRFRIDLLHRLQVIRVNIPPLRSRKSDIPLLVNHYLRQLREDDGLPLKTVTPECMRILKEHPWPGNVRELRNTIYQTVVMAEGDVLLPEHLPQHLIHEGGSESPVNAYQTQPPDSAAPLPENPGAPPVAESVLYPSAQPRGGGSLGTSTEGIFMPLGLSLEELEKLYILKTLSLNGNNKSRAAKMLGMSRKSLYDKLSRWNLME